MINEFNIFDEKQLLLVSGELLCSQEEALNNHGSSMLITLAIVFNMNLPFIIINCST